MNPEPEVGNAAKETHAPEVYQAQGAVSVDLGIGLAEAMARMTAHAVRRELSLLELALLILADDVVLDVADD